MKKLLFFIFLLALLVTFGNEGWLRLYRLRQFEGSLEQEIEELKQKNVLLQKEMGDLKDARYLEALIRDQMGYLREDEILYEFGEEDRDHQSP